MNLYYVDCAIFILVGCCSSSFVFPMKTLRKASIHLASAGVSLALGIVQPLEQVNSFDAFVEWGVLGKTSNSNYVFRCVGLSGLKLDRLVARAVVVVVKVDVDRHGLEAFRDFVKGNIAVHQLCLLDKLAETVAVVLAAKNTGGTVSNQDLASGIALELEASNFLSFASTPSANDCHVLEFVLAVVLDQSTRRVGLVNQVASTSLNSLRLFDGSLGQSLLHGWGSTDALVDNRGVVLLVLAVFDILGNGGLSLVQRCEGRFLLGSNRRSGLQHVRPKSVAGIAHATGNDWFADRRQGVAVVAVAVCTSGVDSHLEIVVEL